FILAKPHCNHDKCIHCGNCAKFCPASAITMVNGYPEFDYGKCIRCYCCHEVCPADAIYLKKNWLAKMVKRS
ncbi:MAG: 4Fe-4S binding protein, partial [Nanoarchaeota archaeon]